MNETLLIETLKKNNVNNTYERRFLFSLLVDLKSPATMNELVIASKPHLDRSTVYRTIDIFEKIGIITKVYTGWKYRIELSDSFDSHHHHITCIECGEVASFEETTELLKTIKDIETEHEFRIISHSFELKGLCKACCYNRSV